MLKSLGLIDWGFSSHIIHFIFCIPKTNPQIGFKKQISEKKKKKTYISAFTWGITFIKLTFIPTKTMQKKIAFSKVKGTSP